VDEGGVKKEFFQLIIKEMFDLKYGLYMFICMHHHVVVYYYLFINYLYINK